VSKRAWPFGQIYYGWVQLVSVSVTEVISWGILYYAFSVFVAPMQAELGWSQVELTGAYSLALLISGLVALPVGRWLDQRGPRALMTAGSILGSLLLLGWSQVHSLLGFYLIMAGIGVAMAAVLYEPAFAIVATWFRQQRGRAFTVLTFFGAWASFIFIPLSAWLVQTLGWRQAMQALAGLLATSTISIHALMLRRSPADLGLQVDGASTTTTVATAVVPERSVTTSVALREPGFWWFSLAFAISTFTTVAITVHLIPYLVSQGQPPSFAAMVTGLFGLMSLVGRLTIGPLGDRYPRRLITAGLMLLQLLGLMVLALVPTSIGALVHIALFGIGSGTLTMMRASLLAERYGPAQYGSINGVQSFALTGARTLAPVGAGLLVAWLHGYPALLWLMIGLTALGILAIFQMADPNHAQSPAALPQSSQS
jgi:MFS family permease